MYVWLRVCVYVCARVRYVISVIKHIYFSSVETLAVEADRNLFSIQVKFTMSFSRPTASTYRQAHLFATPPC